jgi:hypothetical protein
MACVHREEGSGSIWLTLELSREAPFWLGFVSFNSSFGAEQPTPRIEAFDTERKV